MLRQLASATRPVIEQIESRTYLAAATLAAGTPVSITDLDGTAISFTLRGPGTGVVDKDADGVLVNLNRTTVDSLLTISASGGDESASFSRLSVAGSIGSIDATGVIARGRIDVGSYLGSFKIARLEDSHLTADVIDSLEANVISKSRIISNQILRVAVGRDVFESTIAVLPRTDRSKGLGEVTIKGALNGSRIYTLSDIGSVKMRNMIDSEITAGVMFSQVAANATPRQPLPDEVAGDKTYNFTGKYSIGSVSVVGRATDSYNFRASKIAAYQVTQATLSKIRPEDFAHPDMGVSAFRVGKVNVSFEKAYEYLSSDPASAAKYYRFYVRQIEEPIKFDSSTGGYSGNASGGLSGASGRITLDPWTPSYNLPPEYDATIPLIPVAGQRIALVKGDAAAASVYLDHDGRYSLRNRAGNALARSRSLQSLVLGLFADWKTTIKLVDNAAKRTFLVLATSTSPRVEFFRDVLGKKRQSVWADGSPVDTLEFSLSGYGYLSDPFIRPTSASAVITFVQRRIPTTDTIKAALAGSTNGLVTLSSVPFLLPKAGATFASISGPMGSDSLLIMPGGSYKLRGTRGKTFVSVWSAAEAPLGGSRRLPPHISVQKDQLIMIGTGSGGTAVFSNFGLQTLDPAGDFGRTPTMKQISRLLAAV